MIETQNNLGWRDVGLICGSVFGAYALFFWLTSRVDLFPDEIRAAVVALDLAAIGLIVLLIPLRGFPLLETLRLATVTKHDSTLVLLLTVGLAFATTGYSLL
ncbi:MAG TPA: hypothetical protein VJO34_01220, partial [Methylomirabilota bacterium]|nr:hypothetical protein [Methylomirabilota bacterium]